MYSSRTSHSKRLFSLMAGVALLVAYPSFATAQQSDGIEPSDDRIVLTLTPADVPQPALKHQLVIPFRDRKEGNAVVHYGKVKSEQTNYFNSEAVRERIVDVMVMPLDQMLDDENVRTIVSNSTVFDTLRQGARCESCDWQLPVREEPFFEILLPDVQESRQYARLLAARARYQIATGDFEGAVETLQTGFALARNVAKGPTLVNGLVGIAIFRMLADQLVVMGEQPGSPNLYWALSTLPANMVDMRPGLDSEMDAVRLSIPSLKNLHELDRGKEYWVAAMKDTVRTLEMLQGSSLRSDSDGQTSEALIALMSVRAYPLAKASLIEQGWDADTVDAMPVAQVVLIRAMQQYNIVRDHFFKYMELPYYVSVDHTGIDLAKVLEDAGEGPEVLPLTQVFLPALGAVYAARSRQEQHIALLRTIEAIRIYGARHDGELPNSLEEITEVPVPIDPVTGEAFKYEVKDGTAWLEGGQLPGFKFQYEITFAK